MSKKTFGFLVPYIEEGTAKVLVEAETVEEARLNLKNNLYHDIYDTDPHDMKLDADNAELFDDGEDDE